VKLLLVEDKDSFRRLLVQALAGSAWQTTAVADPTAAMELLEQEPFDVLVTDLRLPGFSGLDLLRKAKRARPGLRAVVMSAYGEPKDIVEAMRSGADDFLPKPFDLDLFLLLLDRLRALVGAPPPDPRELWVARSPAMAELEQRLRRIAEAPLPVLFLGEHGAGKGRAARRLHLLATPGAPFAARAAGAFLSQGPDPDLLRLLQRGGLFLSALDELDERGGESLAKAVASPLGKDIRWMGGVVDFAAVPPSLRVAFGALQLVVPPLRERKEDLLPLFHGWLALAAQAEGRTPPDLDKQVERQILERTWVGNVRELSASAQATLRLSVEEGRTGLVLGWPAPGTMDSMLSQVNREAENALLRRALENAGGEPAAAAQALGLSVRTLGLRLREHGIAVKE
jgi:DNA-binding NtrC family response regulator